MKSLLLPSLLAVSFNLHAQTRIDVVPAAPSAGQRFDLTISGQWPNGCGVELRRQSLEDYTITVVIGQRRAEVCTQVVSDYSLPVNPFAEGTSARAGTYKVRYELELDNEPRRLLAFSLIAVGSPTTFDFRPESGNWVAEPGGTYSTSGGGVSIALERQGASLVALTNFFDPNGKAEWLFGSGPFGGGAAKLELMRVSGGQALYNEYRAPENFEASGQLLVEFHTPAQATAWFTQPEGDGFLDNLKLMPISIIPFRSLMESPSDVYAGRFVLTTAGASDAQQYQFERLRFGARDLIGFWDEAQDVQLRCPLDSEREKTLPSRCQLYQGDRLVAEFTQVGHDLLIGSDPSGRQVRLVRS